MFFPIDADEWSKALGQIRRLRHRGNWERIGSSDAYWTKAFFAALVETVDSLLLEKPDLAFKLSTQGILLAERIRADDCPGGTELGKRSLKAWAHAVHGSSCRAGEMFEKAEETFQLALWLSGSKAVLPWAAAEADRRYSALLLTRGSLKGLDFVNRALEGYGKHAVGRAKALSLRAIYFQQLLNDSTNAALDIGQALELIEPKNSPEEARIWFAAIHNLNFVSSAGCGDLSTLRTTLRRVHDLEQRLSKNEGYRRALCSWTEGLLLAPLGSTRASKRLLSRCCGWFFRHQHYLMGTLCGIDLALLQLRDGENQLALATVKEVGENLAAAGPAAAAYLEFWVNHRLAEELSEESLTAFRTAMRPLASRLPANGQPSTMTIGPYSGSSPSS